MARDDEAGRSRTLRRPLEHGRSRATARSATATAASAGPARWRAGRRCSPLPPRRAPDIGHANIRQPRTASRAQPVSDGVSTSNTGFKSSRIDSTSRPPDQKKSSQRAALGRLEQLREIAIAGEKGREARCRARCRAGRFRRRSSTAVRRLTASQPRCHSTETSVGRSSGSWVRCGRRSRRSRRRSPALDKPDRFRPRRRGRQSAHSPMLSGVVSNMIGAVSEIGSAPPQPHRARIARGGRHVLAQRTTAAACRDRARRRRPWPPAARNRRATKLLRGEIELAQHHRIGAAARQHQDGAVVGARDRRRAAPRPVLVFLRRQRVEVEEDVPVRLLGAEAVERGPPPQAARVLGILPEIEELARRASR